MDKLDFTLKIAWILERKWFWVTEFEIFIGF